MVSAVPDTQGPPFSIGSSGMQVNFVDQKSKRKKNRTLQEYLLGSYKSRQGRHLCQRVSRPLNSLVAYCICICKAIMANSCVFPRWGALPAFIVLSVLAVLVSDVEGENQCPPFSCGDLHNISYPFRRPGDPAECGVASYELVCSNSKAIIDINTGTYYVTGINYTRSYFWAVDANLDMNSSCPLPQWNQLPYPSWRLVSSQLIDLVTGGTWACFLNCSRAITNNSRYKPVTCLSTTNSFVYVLASGYCSIGQLEPSCGYLAMIPFGLQDNFQSGLQGQDASYTGIAEITRKGFAVGFPVGENSRKYSFPEIIKKCLNNSTR
jgi:hypothetical protein